MTKAGEWMVVGGLMLAVWLGLMFELIPSSEPFSSVVPFVSSLLSPLDSQPPFDHHQPTVCALPSE